MKKIFLVISAILFVSGCSSKGGTSFIKSTISSYDINQSADRFAKALSSKEYIRLQDMDHTSVAKSKQMYLKPTMSFALSNPTIDSKLIDCNPTLTTDLPIRIGLYRDLEGKVTLVYTTPEYFSSKHNIKDKNCLQLIKIMARDLDEATDSITK